VTDKFLKESYRFIDFAGVIACAGTLAFVQWLLNKDSIEQPETWNFIKFIFIDLICFSLALLIVGRFLGSWLGRYLRLLMVALLGAVVSTSLIDLPFFYRDIQNWQGDTVGWLLKALFIVLLNSFIAVLVMAFMYGVKHVAHVDMD
jgi:hypothetical protein